VNITTASSSCSGLCVGKLLRLPQSERCDFLISIPTQAGTAYCYVEDLIDSRVYEHEHESNDGVAFNRHASTTCEQS
jgi:hypothetical protein